MYFRGRAWIHAIRNRSRFDAELHRELSDYLDELTARYEAEGATPDAARRRALIETGGLDRVKEAVRDQRVGAWLDTTVRDLRSAWRMWRAYPWLTVTAILSLALGIGANTAVFSVMNALFLKSAPVRDPGTLVALYSTSAANPGNHQTSFKNYADLREALPRRRRICDGRGAALHVGRALVRRVQRTLAPTLHERRARPCDTASRQI